MTNIKRFFADESGATAIEYGLLAALISVVGVTAFTNAGSSLKALFEQVESDLSGAVGG
ncbi:MAG: Flp family type IVb pilin [Pseudomonadota bacterium]